MPGRASRSGAASCAPASWTETAPCANPGSSATATASLELDGGGRPVEAAAGDVEARELRQVLRDAGAGKIDPQDQWRMLVARRRGSSAPAPAKAQELIDEPLRMRGATG